MANVSALVPSLPLFPSCYGGIDVLDQCYAGTCVNGSCVCSAGWSGHTDYVPMDLSEWGGPVLSCGVFMPLIKVLWGISLVPGLMVMIMWVPAIMEQYKVRRPAASHHGRKGSNTRGPSSTLHTLVPREYPEPRAPTLSFPPFPPNTRMHNLFAPTTPAPEQHIIASKPHRLFCTTPRAPLSPTRLFRRFSRRSAEGASGTSTRPSWGSPSAQPLSSLRSSRWWE